MNRGGSAILAYHSLDDSGSVISTPPCLFRRQMEFLASSGIPVVALNQVLERPGSVSITFDDGVHNLLEHAIPVLERNRLTATIFIVSGYCGRLNRYPSEGRGLVPELPLLTWEEITALPRLISVGAHTITHPNLTRLPTEECERELRECQDEIEQHLGRAVRWLAYPYGTSSPRVRYLAGRYFDLAVGTSLRFVSARSNHLDLPRIDAYYLRGRFPLERLFTGAGRAYIAFRNLLRGFRQLASG